jgi:hypothetical protein
MTKQASRPGNGRALRRARNIVKRYEREQAKEARAWKWPVGIPATLHHMKVRLEISKNRYERAAALILAQKLSQ